MKKLIMIVLIVGMITWAINDFVDPISEPNSPVQNDYAIEDSSKPVNGTASANPITEGIDVGNIAPDFELKTLDEDTIKLSDFRGKKVMLNFWATWCPPCKEEMPDMQKFHEDKDVVILAVNLTDTEVSKKDVLAFVEEYGLSFPILMDEESKISELFRIKPIPTSYMIDSNGKIQYKVFGAMSYELMVQELEKME